jgi:hypothetical protein
LKRSLEYDLVLEYLNKYWAPAIGLLTLIEALKMVVGVSIKLDVLRMEFVEQAVAGKQWTSPYWRD